VGVLRACSFRESDGESARPVRTLPYVRTDCRRIGAHRPHLSHTLKEWKSPCTRSIRVDTIGAGSVPSVRVAQLKGQYLLCCPDL
jgi:hypothetical protein